MNMGMDMSLHWRFDGLICMFIERDSLCLGASVLGFGLLYPDMDTYLLGGRGRVWKAGRYCMVSLWYGCELVGLCFDAVRYHHADLVFLVGARIGTEMGMSRYG